MSIFILVFKKYVYLIVFEYEASQVSANTDDLFL